MKTLRLQLRFLVPLLLTLVAAAVIALPLLDQLTLRWFARDLNTRGALVANTLSDAIGEAQTDGKTWRVQALFERAVKVLPGGNSRITVFHQPYPVYAVRAQGSRVWDADGVERIDFINNLSSLVHGHNHPDIVKAIQAQAATLASMSMPTESEIALAEVITERVAGVERIRFTNSGTEGVMMALKAARAFTGRPKIAKIEGAYHGSDDTVAVSVNPNPARFDLKKCTAINGDWIRSLAADDLANRILPFLQREDILPAEPTPASTPRVRSFTSISRATGEATGCAMR